MNGDPGDDVVFAVVVVVDLVVVVEIFGALLMEKSAKSGTSSTLPLIFASESVDFCGLCEPPNFDVTWTVKKSFWFRLFRVSSSY